MITLIVAVAFDPIKGESKGKRILETVMAIVISLCIDSLYIIPLLS